MVYGTLVVVMTLRQFMFAVGLSAAAVTLACADPGGGTAEDIVQKGCVADADCPGGRCIDGLPGGLCTSNCVSSAECPSGTVCTDTEAVDGVCLILCSSSSECRDRIGSGYVCDEETDLETDEDVRVCIDE